jgi:hypothetical protein
VWFETEVGVFSVWVQYDPRSGAARFGYVRLTDGFRSGSTVAYPLDAGAARALALARTRDPGGTP